MVYTATSLALAAVELFVNLNPPIDPIDLVAASALLPSSLSVEELPPAALPTDWKSHTYIETQRIGADWMASRRSVALKVPSAAVDQDWNILLNPMHPDFSSIELLPPTPWRFDARMFRRTTP